jgi:hypothetical protein
MNEAPDLEVRKAATMSGQRPGWALRVVLLAAVFLALAAFVSVGVLGLFGSPGNRDLDFPHIYFAGKVWRSGQNPYNPNEYYGLPKGRTFVYPSTSAALALAFAQLPYDSARHLLRAINVLATLVVALFLFRSLDRARAASAQACNSRWLLNCSVVVMATGSGPVLTNLQLGQFSLLVFALLCAAWMCMESGNRIVSGCFAGLASFKPSLELFVYLWFLASRNWRVLLALVVVSLSTAAYPLLYAGPLDLARDWLNSIRAYEQFPENRIEYFGAFGLRPLLKSWGLSPAFTPLLAVAGFGWTCFRSRRMSSLELFALNLAWSTLFLVAHGYDIVMLFPLFLVMLILTCDSTLLMTSVIVGIGAACAPYMVFTRLSAPILVWRFREVICLAFLTALIIAVERRSDQSVLQPIAGQNLADTTI